MCHCAQYVSAEELCDQFCLMKAPRISMSFGSNRQFLLQIEEPEKRSSRKLEVLNVLGPDHTWNSEKVRLVVFASSGIYGVIVSSTQVIEAFLTGDSWSVPRPRKSRERENIATSVPSGSLPRIPNPIMCVNEGDLVLFQLSILTERASSHYPIYQKDNLFNTNPHWDFGAFRRLDYLIRETNVNISRFAHVFRNPGTYVFQDNAIRERSLFVTVKDRNVHCDPENSHIQPSSPYQLTKIGIVPQQKLNLAPNWGVILGVLLLLFIVLIVLLIITVLLRPSLYMASPMKKWKPRWRSLGEPYIPPEYVLTRDSLQFYEAVGCHGSGEMLDIGRKEITYGLDERHTIPVLEDFSVRTLFDKLEDQTLHLTSQLGRHRNETLSFYKAFIQRIQLLKDMIQNLELRSSKGLEWRKGPSDGEVESMRTNITSQQSEGSATSTAREKHTEHIQAEFLQESTALMKALKLTLMKTTAEVAIKKVGAEMKQQRYSVIDGTNDLRANGLEDQNHLKKSPYEGIFNGNMAMLSMEGLHLQPLQYMTALYREDNLRRLISASPLIKTLEEIKESLKTQAQENEIKESVTFGTTGDLVPINISHLSPRQMVVYQFGSAVLHCVCHSCSQNPLFLLVAEDIVRVQSSVWGKEALRLGESQYDMENNILYVPKTALEHAGELAVSIIHAVAQIKAGRQQLSVNLDYLHCMNRAVTEICAMFFHRWGMRSASLTDKCEKDPDVKSLTRDLLFIHKLPDHYCMPKSYELPSKIKLWNEYESTFRKATDFAKRQNRGDHSDTTVLQEETLDGLNEEFLQLVTQALQNKKEREELTHNLQCDKDPSVLHSLSEKTHMAAMLEIKRRCTEEKIRTVESGLLYLQQPNTTCPPSLGSREDHVPTCSEM